VILWTADRASVPAEAIVYFPGLIVEKLSYYEEMPYCIRTWINFSVFHVAFS